MLVDSAHRLSVHLASSTVYLQIYKLLITHDLKALNNKIFNY